MKSVVRGNSLRLWRQSARVTLDRIGGPHALDPIVILVIAVWFAVITFIADIVRRENLATSIRLTALAGVISIVVLVLYLLVIRWLLRRSRQTSVHPLVMLAVFASAGLVRNISLNVAFSALDLPSTSDRVGGAVLSAVLIMSLATITISRTVDHRRQRETLLEERQRLVIAGTIFEERARATQSELVNQVHRELDPAIAKIREQFVALGPTTESEQAQDSATIAALVGTVSEIVRPMSTELGTKDSTTGREFESFDLRPSSRSRLLKVIDVPDSIRPA